MFNNEEPCGFSKSLRFWFILLPLIKNLTLAWETNLEFSISENFCPTFNIGLNFNSYWTFGLTFKLDKFVSNTIAFAFSWLLPEIWTPAIIGGVDVSPNWKLPVAWTPSSWSPTG